MLDPLIDQRRESLSKEGLSKRDLDKRAEALVILIKARLELDVLGEKWKEPPVNVTKISDMMRPPTFGDFNVSLGK